MPYKTLYIHKFSRDDGEDDYWTEYVVSTSSTISSEWRNITSENETVVDYAETSDIYFQYPNVIKI